MGGGVERGVLGVHFVVVLMMILGVYPKERSLIDWVSLFLLIFCTTKAVFCTKTTVICTTTAVFCTTTVFLY